MEFKINPKMNFKVKLLIIFVITLLIIQSEQYVSDKPCPEQTVFPNLEPERVINNFITKLNLLNLIFYLP